MRAAALADGVVLRVRAAYREPEESQRRAAAADNDNAVAEFSSHNPGLAIDLQMGHRWQDPEDQSHRQRFAEATTTPMQNVIDMRESPVRKWMFLHGAEYGWFPFQQEPWHWEYNPEGFHDEFAANVAAEEEAAAAAAAEAAARARENRENHEPEEQPEE